MDREVLKSLLFELGISPGKRGTFKDSGSNIQMCCPFHGEHNPSAGITDEAYGNCFSCGETFSLAKLVAHCKGFTKQQLIGKGQYRESYDWEAANDWLEERFGIDFKKLNVTDKYGHLRILEKEDGDGSHTFSASATRFVMEKVKIAPFKCGKETHEYYFERGFTPEDAKTFMMGWDRFRKRIVFPAFWEDGELCGIMGRAILPDKINGEDNPEYYRVYKDENMPKYFIYDKFPIGESLYPLWLFKPRDIGGGRKLAILVEGYLDCQWMHKHGHPETLSTVNAKVVWDKKKKSSVQIDILISHGVTDVLLMRDNDWAGERGTAHDYPILKEFFTVWKMKYPKGKKDPHSLHPLQIKCAVSSRRLMSVKDFSGSKIKG